MIVSNFEISRSSSGRGFHDTFYQLQVTNMADNEIEFLAETHIGVRPGINSMLSNVTTKLLNVNLTDGFSFRRRGGEYVQGAYFRIAPKTSAIFEINQTTVRIC